eukprot:COSAG01_NODE_24520_length_773_cov_0.943870_1_plen_217_part_10
MRAACPITCGGGCNVTIAYTSFEEPAATGRSSVYRDTLSASTSHRLRNNPAQPPVAHAGCSTGNAELGFTAYYVPLHGCPRRGLSDSQLIGVIGDSTTGTGNLGGGSAPHGTQYYMLQDTDSWVYVKLDPVWVTGYRGVQMKAWVHVEDTNKWNRGDRLKVWAIDDTTASEVVLLEGTDLDNVNSVTTGTVTLDQWVEYSAALANFTTTATMAFGLT